MDTPYTYRTAEDFDTIYESRHEAGTAAFRAGALSTPILYTDQSVLDAVAQSLAQQYRERQQASVPNFTDDDVRFDAAWAAGYIVGTIAEQDAYRNDPESYLAEICQSDALRLPATRVVEAEDPVQLPLHQSARQLDVPVLCTLEYFLDLTVEGDEPGTKTWTMASSYVLVWERSAYSGERQGLDHLTVRKGDQDLDEFVLYQDTDSDVVEAILKLIAKGSQAAEIFGHLS
jgi:hypothetical protein